MNQLDAIIRKEIPEDENSEKVINIKEKIFNFNNHQKGKGLKILTPKQMLQRLAVTLAQVKASKYNIHTAYIQQNTSNNIFFVLSKRN